MPQQWANTRSSNDSTVEPFEDDASSSEDNQADTDIRHNPMLCKLNGECYMRNTDAVGELLAVHVRNGGLALLRQSS